MTDECPTPLESAAAERDRRLDQRIDYEAKLSDERDRRYNERFLAVKELVETKLSERDKATSLGVAELERRLNGLNELREDVVKDRSQFVKVDVYVPGHEELRRQRVVDSEKLITLAGVVQTNATEIAAIKNSLMWLTRLIAGALIMGVLGYIFQRLAGR
jgi:hypothetical protein